MPTTRKKVIRTVYKDDESDEENEDFVDSGSEAEITGEPTSSDEEAYNSEHSDVSDQDFKSKPTSMSKVVSSERPKPRCKPLKPKAHQMLSKMKDKALSSDEEQTTQKSTFTVNDLTDSDKLLPSVLHLSESDSSGDDEPSTSKISNSQSFSFLGRNEVEQQEDTPMEYKDVWSKNLKNDSEEIARKTFQELEKHKMHFEATKASVAQYTGANTSKVEAHKELDVQAMLAQGGDVSPDIQSKKLKKKEAVVEDSDSDDGDFEEVNEAKGIPQQGLQLIVDFPDGSGRKAKKVDVEMMMRRRINRVKKEYQVYMHKVHLLCWIGHGNFVSKVLNDQDIMAAVLTLVPGKECYPSDRVEIKYVEQIVTWFKDKLRITQDKNEHKFKPKAPPLKDILLSEIKKKSVSTKKYLVFIFVSLLRAMGVQCRVMFNFVTLPLKPPMSQLCSLSTKPKDGKETNKDDTKTSATSQKKVHNKKTSTKRPRQRNIKQLDGQYDSSSDSTIMSDYEFENIMQLDGNDDNVGVKKRSTRSAKNTIENCKADDQEDDVSPPKLRKLSLSTVKPKDATKDDKNSKNKQTSPSPSEKPIPKASPRKTRSSSKNDQSDMTIPKQQTKGKPKETLKQDTQTLQSMETDKATVTIKDVEMKVNSRSRRSTSRIKETTTCEQKQKSSTKQKDNSQQNTLEDESKKTDRPESSSLQKKPKIKEKIEKKPAANSVSIKVTDETGKESVPSIYFNKNTVMPEPVKKLQLSRKRSHTATELKTTPNTPEIKDNTKSRTKNAPGTEGEKSKYFVDSKDKTQTNKGIASRKRASKAANLEDSQRVSHRDLKKGKANPSNDITGDLVDIIKSRVSEAKSENKKNFGKAKVKHESEGDSDYLPEESGPNRRNSDDDFKPTKISPKARPSKKIDRRVLSSDDETVKNKTDVWCEVFVEELEQWVAVDVIKAQVHCAAELYARATHPVNYIVGWDNNNNLKDLTRRYVPHWNTVTRKQRVEPDWWATALRPWLGPKNAKDKEEDEQLDRMLLEAPLPKSIAEYKNHPLYALERHLLKFEAIYPPDAATLGFVRGQAVYARECVYVCRSRDTWLKEAKTVKLGQKPYKVVKARPKWDKLSNKVISDLPLEVFGPWQVQDYEPPTAENGIVPRNAYGNVELFKTCMLPKKTVHMKLPGLNKVAKKLNIDCAPAMVGFDFNGGYTHPVFDGFVVCEEFEDVLAEAWQMDQEEQERKETEKLETRVYGNWKRLIKGLFIRERLKQKYGFKEVADVPDKKKAKGPRLAVKKKY